MYNLYRQTSEICCVRILKAKQAFKVGRSVRLWIFCWVFEIINFRNFGSVYNS